MGSVNMNLIDEEIFRLRTEERLPWRKIGKIVGLSHEGARKIYLKITAQMFDGQKPLGKESND